jgi:hypothetical protein
MTNQPANIPDVPQPPAPAAPSPDIAPGARAPVVAGAGIQLQGVPSTPQELAALKVRRSELSDQLQSATSRRNQLASRIRGAEGVDRIGLEQRLQLLDRRILQLETDLAVTGEQLASTPANLVAVPMVGVPNVRFRSGEMARGAAAVGSLFTLLVFAPLAFAAARLMWRRASQPAAPRDTESAQRLARLETAVDSIAIEMERVAEGQRFLTRLLAESNGIGQLGAIGTPGAHPERVPVPITSEIPLDRN